jgi:serine/threonine-protein kinase
MYRRPASPEEALLLREVRGRYALLGEIGRGGMGIVFLARDLALHRVVAIKALRGELMSCAEERERFRREARLTARLNHPNIVAVHAFAETDELMYMVMQYVDGESLSERLRRQGRLAPAEVRRALSAVALALAYAHREGIVHRDLTASNILIDRQTGRAMITDFGVAALPSSGDAADNEARHAFGTPHYMSPEQAAGERDLDGRSDIYSLGVLGYALLCGDVPFNGPSFRAIAAKHMTEPLVPLKRRVAKLPAQLAEAVERCLAKEPSARWGDAQELHDALVARPLGFGTTWELMAAALVIAILSLCG